MFNLDDCFALITCRSSKLFAKALEKQLSYYNITRAQWTALYYIHYGDNITQKELADKMSMREPTIARLIQTLEGQGYIKRLSSDKDKRIKRLQLTEEGTKVCISLIPVVEEFKEKTVAGIDEDDLKVYKKVLDKMKENVLKL